MNDSAGRPGKRVTDRSSSTGSGTASIGPSGVGTGDGGRTPIPGIHQLPRIASLTHKVLC